MTLQGNEGDSKKVEWSPKPKKIVHKGFDETKLLHALQDDDTVRSINADYEDAQRVQKDAQRDQEIRKLMAGYNFGPVLGDVEPELQDVVHIKEAPEHTMGVTPQIVHVEYIPEEIHFPVNFAG